VAGFLVAVGTAESISAFGDPAGQDAAARLDAYRERSKASGVTQDLDDVGDEAVLGPTGLAARIDTVYVEIIRSTLTDHQVIEVARLIAQRLKSSM
jgi:hypothetical protein